MAKIKTEYWAIDRLTPYPNNAKDHPPEQVAELVAIIKQVGFVQPILVDGAGEIIAGHGRLLAAQSLKMETVPVIQLKHLTEPQIMALRIADNSVPLRGTWNPEILQAELERLTDMDFDISAFGLDNIELPPIEELGAEAPPARNRTKTTIFLSVKNADASKARKACIAALNKAKIEHNL